MIGNGNGSDTHKELGSGNTYSNTYANGNGNKYVSSYSNTNVTGNSNYSHNNVSKFSDTEDFGTFVSSYLRTSRERAPKGISQYRFEDLEEERKFEKEQEKEREREIQARNFLKEDQVKSKVRLNLSNLNLNYSNRLKLKVNKKTVTSSNNACNNYANIHTVGNLITNTGSMLNKYSKIGMKKKAKSFDEFLVDKHKQNYKDSVNTEAGRIQNTLEKFYKNLIIYNQNDDTID